MEFKEQVSVHAITTLPYTYRFLSGKTREGVLIRVEEDGVFGEGIIEQSDRDPPISLDHELEGLRLAVPDSAGWRALHMAEEARRCARTLAQPLQTLTNAILTEWNRSSIERVQGETSLFGWKRAKVKLSSLSMTEQFLEEAPQRFPHMVWIIDYEECFSSSEEARRALKLLNASCLPILYVEDPCPYDLHKWQRLQDEGIALAVDRHFLNCSLAELLPFVALYKPYLGGYTTMCHFLAAGGTGAITCSMVHPVEQGYTLMKAAVLQKNYPESILHVGCATHTLLDHPPMKERFSVKEGVLSYKLEARL